MTEKIVPAHGSSVARVDIPADCKWRVSDIYIDERPHIRGEKEACGPYHFHIFPFRHQKNNRLLRIIRRNAYRHKFQHGKRV